MHKVPAAAWQDGDQSWCTGPAVVDSSQGAATCTTRSAKRAQASHYTAFGRRPKLVVQSPENRRLLSELMHDKPRRVAKSRLEELSTTSLGLQLKEHLAAVAAGDSPYSPGYGRGRRHRPHSASAVTSRRKPRRRRKPLEHVPKEFVKTLRVLLSTCGLPVQYASALVYYGFDSMGTLASATFQDLLDVGLRRGHASTLQRLLKQSFDSTGAPLLHADERLSASMLDLGPSVHAENLITTPELRQNPKSRRADVISEAIMDATSNLLENHTNLALARADTENIEDLDKMEHCLSDEVARLDELERVEQQLHAEILRLRALGMQAGIRVPDKSKHNAAPNRCRPVPLTEETLEPERSTNKTASEHTAGGAERLAAEEDAAEPEHLAAKQDGKDRQAGEAREAERLAAEQRVAAEQAEKDRQAAQLEAERLAAEEDAAEAERVTAQQAEKDRQAAQLEAERLAAEEDAAEAEHLAAEHLAAEQAEKARQVEQAEAERLAAEEDAAEAERVTAEQAEKDRQVAQLEAERLAAEEDAAEAERVTAEQAEKDRQVAQLEAERLAAEEDAAEAERVTAEQAEKDRQAAQLEAERLAAEEDAAEAERVIAEQTEKNRQAAKVQAERLTVQESERVAAIEEAAEAQRVAAEQLEAERLAAEEDAAKAEHLAAEQTEKDRQAAKAEAERLAAEEDAAKAEHLAAEHLAAEHLAAEQAEKARQVEQAEAERLAAEEDAAEAERVTAEQAEKDQQAAQLEAERLAAEEEAAEAERVAAEQAEKARQVEQAEAERLAAEEDAAKAEHSAAEHLAAEQAEKARQVEQAEAERLAAEEDAAKAEHSAAEHLAAEQAEKARQVEQAEAERLAAEEDAAEAERLNAQAVIGDEKSRQTTSVERVQEDSVVAVLFHAHERSGDGLLNSSELRQLLVALRQRAINGKSDDTDDGHSGSTAQDEWLQPTDEELQAAMSAMDRDGDGFITLPEFSTWWNEKGGWEYAEDPGMWGYFPGEDDNEKYEMVNAGDDTKRVLPMTIPADRRQQSETQVNIFPQQDEAAQKSSPLRRRAAVAKNRVIRFLNRVTDNIVVPVSSPEHVEKTPEALRWLATPSDRLLNSVSRIVFPNNAEDEEEPEVLQLESSNVLYSVVALFDRLPTGTPEDQEDDLWFNAGQVIDVLQESVDGWGDGWGIGTTSPSVRGFFPRNFVRRLSAAEQVQQQDRLYSDKITRWVTESEHVSKVLVPDDDALRRKPVMI